ncbi:MAG: DUF1554 domain-containing protein [Spirochaetia bacterium]|nr:DUF1554 domain-containing protein [Spirochaetia bacterium]
MILSQQVAGAGVLITPVSGHTHDLGLAVGDTSVSGKAGVYISLRSQPSADVTVGPFSVSIPSTAAMIYPSGAATSITFTPANWSTPVLVAYAGVADLAVTGDQTYTIAFGSTVSQDQLYNGITLPSQTNVNEDRDKYIYVTAGAWMGSAVGGTAGADTKCNAADANKPALAWPTYQALLADGVNRIGSVTSNAGDGQKSWPLKAGYLYHRASDNARIFYIGSSRIYPLGTGAPPGACPNYLGSWISRFTVGATLAWTGLQCDWTTDANICTGWAGAGNGAGGNTSPVNDVSTLNAGNQACGLPTASLICVQQ